MLKLIEIPISKIVPYWRNPRDNNDLAVAMVVDSIQRYGYLVPILLDQKNTIILGHTRYKALKKLGVETVKVLVTDMGEQEAKEYRNVDNKTSEYSNWLPENLMAEYQDLGKPMILEQYFPMLYRDGTKVETSTETTPEGAEERVQLQDGDYTEMLCPHCYNGFTITWAEAQKVLNNG